MRIQVVMMLLAASFIMARCGEEGISSEKMVAGKKVYDTYCLGCHMTDGTGVPDMNAPLAGSAYVAGDKEKLITIVLQGSAAFANDPERPYKNLMGSMSNLSNQEIADVLTYVRNSFGNKAPVIAVEDVQSVREKKN